MTPLPPPYLSLSFETVEARLWATDTINNVFTGSTKDQLLPSPPIYEKPLPPTPPETIFDPAYFHSGSHTLMDRSATATHRSSLRRRRHTTSLSSSSSSSSYTTTSSASSSAFSSEKHQLEPDSNGSSPITFSPASSMSDCLSLSGYSDPGAKHSTHHNGKQQKQQRHSPSSATSISLPASPSRMLSRRSTITHHLKRHWALDDSTTSSSVRRLFTSEQLLKERKALDVWRKTLHGYLLDPAYKIPAPRHTKDSPRLAYCIVSEMLATEETYLGHLLVLKQVFIDSFLQTFQNRYMIRDLQTIFSHIPQLITLSSSLVRRWYTFIEQRTHYVEGKIMVKDNNTQDIGKTFCDLEDEFKVYTYYAVHYAKAQKCIARMEQKPSYQQWMHSVLQNKEIKRMGLADYLIAPIQRITRHCLLVKDLMKHTKGQDVELERALKYLTALAVAMNNCQQ